MARAYIGIGSNLGDRCARVEAVRAQLAKLPGTTLAAFSPVYETAPVGPVEQGKFLNAAAAIQTKLTPRKLLDELNRMEQQAGRPAGEQRVKWGPRPLDLDILMYDDLVVGEEDLTIPHPHMHERWFVLKPLADIAPQAVHPTLKRTVAQLLAELKT